MRFGGRWLTDLNIDNRTVHIYQASFEIGWPLGSTKVTTIPRYQRLAGYQVITKDRATQRVKLVIDARRIEFDYDQATIRPEAHARLSRLGRFLAANKENWEKLMISGHTDERGTVEYNQKLSENRARAVLDVMVVSGVPRAKMKSQGFSENVPIDPGHNEYAWQRNRRVEFEFTGVRDMDLIIDGVNQSTDDQNAEGTE
jgi:outer membrane protein OmpA-like peptidoglycan-associated protein